MKEIFEEKFKSAIEFLEKSDIYSPNKPAIPHLKNVAKYLFEKEFSDEVVLAGLFHDMLEWSSVTAEELENKFGSKVVSLISANTKDRSIEDKIKRRQSQIDNCLKIGDEALAVKIADNLDSFNYYSKIKNEKELERCREWANLLSKNLSDNLRNIFANDLASINN
ncbi:MAG: HD domain-containing protein [Patescibacteria group bacterium]|nr:HD domain-containing protein [Patescibacteria group bacterium]